MSRSRAFNRSNRFVAKKRRRVLRSIAPSFEDKFRPNGKESFEEPQSLRFKAWEEAAMLDLSDPELMT